MKPTQTTQDGKNGIRVEIKERDKKGVSFNLNFKYTFGEYFRSPLKKDEYMFPCVFTAGDKV
tara:strand:+ start:9407 stop:9592 length:186 start_codon:yes stop_codon:yes gene_type:complete